MRVNRPRSPTKGLTGGCMRNSQMTIILDGDCIALVYRYGFGDQGKPSEYMPNDYGSYFDNEGNDSTKFKNKEQVLEVLRIRYPGIKEIEI